MITQKQVKHYWDKGWVVIEGIFNAHEAEKIAQTANLVMSKELKKAEVVSTEQLPDGTIIPRKINKAFFKHTEFQKFVLDYRLHKAIKTFINKPPLLLADQILMKPPHHGGPKPYPQDNFHFQCSPVNDVITAWIALDDVDEENGCLRYISGSHNEGMLPHFPMENETYNMIPNQDRVDLAKEELAPVHKGGVVFHHGYTLHSSSRNYSDRWRRGYATHWITADAKRIKGQGDLDNANFKDARYQSMQRKLNANS